MDDLDVGYDFSSEISNNFDGLDEDRDYVRDRGPVLHEESWLDRKMIGQRHAEQANIPGTNTWLSID